MSLWLCMKLHVQSCSSYASSRTDRDLLFLHGDKRMLKTANSTL